MANLGPTEITEKEMESNRLKFLGEMGCWVERTPVHEAASLGQSQRLQQLIQGGASINTMTMDCMTPLHEACIQGQAQCVQLLLEAGAQVDVRTIHGSTALCTACAAGSPECTKLLLEHGATANPTLTALTATPLHEACIRGNVDCARLMIAGGGHLEPFDIYFGTPLQAACLKHHLECAKELLKAGAGVNTARFHETALHIAAKENNVDFIEMLVEFGANVNARDNIGRKPIDYTSPGSLCNTSLQFYQSTPLSLQQLSRVVFRRALGTRAEEALSKLGLSPRIFDYLSYR